MSQTPVYTTNAAYAQPMASPSPVPVIASPVPTTYAPQYVTASPSYSPVMIPQLRSDPVVLDCPRCRATVQTSTQFKVGGATWLWAVIGCVLCGSIGCPCIGAIPFCVDGCKDVEHSCPSCGYFIGKYSRM